MHEVGRVTLWCRHRHPTHGPHPTRPRKDIWLPRMTASTAVENTVEKLAQRRPDAKASSARFSSRPVYPLYRAGGATHRFAGSSRLLLQQALDLDQGIDHGIRIGRANVDPVIVPVGHADDGKASRPRRRYVAHGVAYHEGIAGVAAAVDYLAELGSRAAGADAEPRSRREALLAHLKSRGIGHKVYYPLALHLQPCFADLGFKQGTFPHAEQATREVLALPIYAELTEAQQAYVVEQVVEFYCDGREKGGGPTLSPPKPSRDGTLPTKSAGSPRARRGG